MVEHVLRTPGKIFSSSENSSFYSSIPSLLTFHNAVSNAAKGSMLEIPTSETIVEQELRQESRGQRLRFIGKAVSLLGLFRSTDDRNDCEHVGKLSDRLLGPDQKESLCTGFCFHLSHLLLHTIYLGGCSIVIREEVPIELCPNVCSAVTVS